MWTKRSKQFCEASGVEVPIIQAPMAGGPTTPSLVATVSNAGALGSLGAGYLAADALRGQLEEISRLTDKPYSVNLFVPEPITKTSLGTHAGAELDAIASSVGLDSFTPNLAATTSAFHDQVQVLLDFRVPIVSFTFGVPEPAVISQFRDRGVALFGTATCREEAIALRESGCAGIVAQGAEAGGHRGSFARPDTFPLIGTTALVPQICDVVDLPVVAAGGIMDGRGIASALALGASAVQMGTAFLTSTDAGTDAVWVERVLSSSDTDTALTRAFSGKPARGIENAFMRRMRPFEAELPSYPIQNQVTTPIRNAAKQKADGSAMSLWAGQGAVLARRLSAADLIDVLRKETDAAIGTLTTSS